MYIVRDIFQLQFGHFGAAKTLLAEGKTIFQLPELQSIRVLSDFTGDAYRLILEGSYNSLSEYETSLTADFSNPAWKSWYEKFKPHIVSSHREILKVVDI
jgi:hypothetical protein